MQAWQQHFLLPAAFPTGCLIIIYPIGKIQTPIVLRRLGSLVGQHQAQAWRNYQRASPISDSLIPQHTRLVLPSFGLFSKMSDAAASATPAAAAEELQSKLNVDAAPAEAAAEPPHPSGMTLDERYKLARSVGEECINEEELRALLAKKPNVVAYDGFEPSGRMHIAQGVMKAINVNKLTKVGCTFKFWVADWFAQLNNKMGGDLKKIQTVGKYMVEVWKAVGMDLSKVRRGGEVRG